MWDHILKHICFLFLHTSYSSLFFPFFLSSASSIHSSLSDRAGPPMGSQKSLAHQVEAEPRLFSFLVSLLLYVVLALMWFCNPLFQQEVYQWSYPRHHETKWWVESCPSSWEPWETWLKAHAMGYWMHGMNLCSICEPVREDPFLACGAKLFSDRSPCCLSMSSGNPQISYVHGPSASGSLKS